MSVVGLGPGDQSLLAPEARQALEQSQVIVGYSGYIDLLSPELVKGKEVISRGMRRELDRASLAVGRCLEGLSVAVVSSGDAGVYGMAGLVLEYLEKTGGSEKIDCRIIPGIPALCAAAAILGAPLVHDFAVISLSDLLTPWELIEKRLKAAARADFSIVIYNPKSKRRSGHLERALNIIAENRNTDPVLGWVRKAYRPGQESGVDMLSKFSTEAVDMTTILIVGNSRTRISSGRMVTPRGYFDKYDIDGKAFKK